MIPGHWTRPVTANCHEVDQPQRIWVLPKSWGVSPNPCYFWIFYYKPINLEYPHLWKPPFLCCPHLSLNPSRITEKLPGGFSIESLLIVNFVATEEVCTRVSYWGMLIIASRRGSWLMSESQSCFSKTKRVSYRSENRPIAFGTHSDLLVTPFGCSHQAIERCALLPRSCNKAIYTKWSTWPQIQHIEFLQWCMITWC